MPVYTIKEFANLTGKEAKNIHVYCSRGKLVKNEHKQIDTTNALNFAFLEENKHNNTTSEDNPKKDTTNVQGRKQMQIDYTKHDTKHDKEVKKKKLNHIQELSEEKLELEVKQKRLAVIKAEIEIQNKRGELMETTKALNIASSFAENMKKDFRNKSQALVKKICLRYNIPSNKAAEYCLTLDDLINESNKSSIEFLSENFKNDQQ